MNLLFQPLSSALKAQSLNDGFGWICFLLLLLLVSALVDHGRLASWHQVYCMVSKRDETFLSEAEFYQQPFRCLFLAPKN